MLAHDDKGGFYYCVGNGPTTTTMAMMAASSGGATWDTLLAKWEKGRTIAVGNQEDAGINEGKGNREGLAGPLLNIAMPWATAGAAGITIIAVLRVASVHVTVFVLSNLPYS